MDGYLRPVDKRLSAAELDRRLAELSIDPNREKAKLLATAGWSQQELAAKMGKSQAWISGQILFGKFLKQLPQGAKVTQRTFQTLWGQTDAKAEESIRLQAVLDLVERHEIHAQPKPSRMLADRIMAHFADGKWHAIDAITERLGTSKDVVDATLEAHVEGSPHRAKTEFKTVGVRPHCRIFRADRPVLLSELKEKFGPIIAELKQQGKANAATVSIPTVGYCAHKLQQIIDEWSA